MLYMWRLLLVPDKETQPDVCVPKISAIGCPAT